MFKQITQSLLDSNIEKSIKKSLDITNPNIENQRQALVNLILEHQSKLSHSPLLKQINDLRTLLEIYLGSTQEFKETLKNHIEFLINIDAQKGSEQIHQLINDSSSNEILVELIIVLSNFINSESLLNNFLSNLSVNHTLLVLINTHNDRCKDIIISDINNIDELREIEKKVLNKDKRTAHLIKNKIDYLKEIEHKYQMLVNQSESLLNSFKNLASSSYAPLYDSKLEHLSNEWSEMEQKQENHSPATEKYREWLTKNDIESKINNFKNIAKNKVDNYMQTEKLNNQKIADKESIRLTLSKIKNLFENNQTDIREIEELIRMTEQSIQENDEIKIEKLELESFKKILVAELEAVDNLEFNQIQSELQELELLFHSNHKRKQASQQTFHLILSKISQIEKALSKYPDNQTFETSLQKKLQGTLEQLKQYYSQSQSTQEEFKEKFNKKTGYIKNEIENKALSTVSRLIKEAQEIIAFCPEAQQEQLQKRIDVYLEDKKQLEDWVNFATLPKRKELCEAMESLAHEASRTKIKLLKEKIKTLQNEWKQLGFAKDEEAKALWKRFQLAGDTAYLPIKQLIDKKENEKQANLQTRQRAIESLNILFEGNFSNNTMQSHDWQTIEKSLRRNKNLWEKAFPVPANSSKLESEFNDIVSQIERKLKPQRAINLGIKNRLIEQAKKISEADDNRRAIEQIKTLQEEWKTTGYCEEDEVLWNVFRNHCDVVFKQRDQLRDKQLDQEKSDIESAKLICQKLDNLDGTIPDNLEQEFNKLCSDFNELGNIPKKRSDINKQFSKAKQNALKRIQILKQKQGNERFNKLVNFSKSLADIENSILGKNNFHQYEEKLKNLIDEYELDEQSGKTVIETQDNMAQIIDVSAFQQERILAITRLCIELEIELDLPSPKQDQKLRMEIQVQRLNKKFNSLEKGSGFQDKIEHCFKLGGLFSFVDSTLTSRLLDLQGKL